MSPKPIIENTLFYGDNLPILREYVPDESVDLIYLDPPFNSNRSYNGLRIHVARHRRAHRRIGKRAERPQAASTRLQSRHIIALELSRLAKAECALEFQASQGRPTQR